MTLLSLEWERKIPEDAINSLKTVMAGDDFNEKLPEVINKINQLSYKTFNDLPRGGVKTGESINKVNTFRRPEVQVHEETCGPDPHRHPATEGT